MPPHSKSDTFVFNGMGIPEDAFKELQIDIDCDDETKIRAQIEQMRKVWSQAQSTEKDVFRLKIDPIYIPILSDASSRNEYRLFIKARRKREYDHRVRQARLQVEAWLKDSQATDEFKQRIVRMCSDPLGPTAEELETWFQAPRSGAAPTLPAMAAVQQLLFDLEMKPLPPHKSKPIADNCQKIGKANLYDFLGLELSDAEDAAKIGEAKRLREDEKNRLGNEGLDGALKPIFGNLIASVEELLVRDAAKRRQYLRTIGEDRLAPMMTTLDLKFRAEKDRKLSPTEKVLAAEFIGVLLSSVDGVIPKPVAMHIILRRAGEEGYNVQMPAITMDELVCPSCQMPNAKDVRNCSCGYQFILTCPKCSNVFSGHVGRCDRCGLDATAIGIFESLLIEVARLIKERALSDAQNLILKARVDVGGGNADLNELERQIVAPRQEADAALVTARGSVQIQKLYEARGYLASVLRIDKSDAEGKRLMQIVETTLHAVSERLEAARGLETAGRIEDAASEYGAILEACTDCPDALQAMRRLPPYPPSDLTVVVMQRRVVLNWQPSASNGAIQYKVVRKVGGVPSVSTDGTEVGTTQAHSLDDLKTPVGSAVFYAVYAIRGGTLSEAPAASPEVLVTSEVEDLAATSADGVINISWRLPGQVHDVIVVRQTNCEPKSVDDGDRISLSGLSNVTDRGVINNQMYHYTVFCRYRSGEGGLIISSGACVSASPQPLPPPLLGFRIHPEGTRIRVGWDQPACREVLVVRTPRPPSLKPGASISKAKIDSIGTVLQPLGEAEAVDTSPNNSLSYYTVFTANGETAVVGATQQFTNLPDASGLRVEKTAGVLEAYWKWPPISNIAKIGWCQDEHPASVDDPKADFARITVADYNSHGRFLLPVRDDADCYLTVFTGVSSPDGDIYAGGQCEGARASYAGGRQITVSYLIKKPFFGSKRQIQFSAINACELPDAVIVAKSGSLPASIGDGIILAHLGKMSISGTTASSIDMPASPRGHFVKIFLSNPKDYARFLLMHPPKDTLRF